MPRQRIHARRCAYFRGEPCNCGPKGDRWSPFDGPGDLRPPRRAALWLILGGLVFGSACAFGGWIISLWWGR